MKALTLDELKVIEHVAGGYVPAHKVVDTALAGGVGRFAGVATTAFVDGFLGAWGASWWSGGIGILAGLAVGTAAAAMTAYALEKEDVEVHTK